MSSLHYEMAAFHDELVKHGASPVMEIAKQVVGKAAPLVERAMPLLGKLKPKGAIEAANLAARGMRGAGELAKNKALSAGQAVGNFGKRQVHGLTGWTPKAGLGSIGFEGSKATAEALGAARAATPEVGGTGILQRVMHGNRAGTQGLAERVKQRAVQRAEKLHEATKAHEAMGLTNLPAWGKGLATKPVETLRAGLGKEWHSGMMGKAMVGLPVAGAAHQLVTPTQEGGPGRLARAGSSLGELSWAMGVPIAPAIAASKGISSAFKAPEALRGKLAKVKRKPELGKHPAPPSIDAGGQTQPAERIMTPAAMGQPPEDMIG
jgi:hypothetical protein